MQHLVLHRDMTCIDLRWREQHTHKRPPSPKHQTIFVVAVQRTMLQSFAVCSCRGESLRGESDGVGPHGPQPRVQHERDISRGKGAGRNLRSEIPECVYASQRSCSVDAAQVQCVAVCCSVLRCVAVCCSVLAVCCIAVAGCCNNETPADLFSRHLMKLVRCSAVAVQLQCSCSAVAVCCSGAISEDLVAFDSVGALQFVAVSCSVLQCVAV